MQFKSFEDFKNDLRKQLEHIAVMRRVGKDLGYDVNEIDQFIAEEGAIQFDRFEEKSEIELMVFMLNDILENAPDDIKSNLSL